MRVAYWPAVYQRDLYDRGAFDRDHHWVELAGSYELFGPRVVLVIPKPGHTPGRRCLVVALASGRYVLGADASYLSSKMRERRLSGVVWNADETVASWRRLVKLERTAGATLPYCFRMTLTPVKTRS